MICLTRPLSIFVATLALLTVSAEVMAGKTYKWLDDEGNVVYTDRQPPPGMQLVDEYAREATADPRSLALQQAVSDNPITLYVVPGCDACDLVRSLLDKARLPFSERNAEGDVAVQGDLKKLTGTLTVPVLVIGEEVITGYSGSIIRSQLTRAGYDLEGPPPGTELAARGGPEIPLSAEQAQSEAAEAAEELLADSEDADLGWDADETDEWEEIPEEERIQIPAYAR